MYLLLYIIVFIAVLTTMAINLDPRVAMVTMKLNRLTKVTGPMYMITMDTAMTLTTIRVDMRMITIIRVCHLCTHTRICTLTRTYSHSYSLTHILSLTHTLTHTLIHTHTQKHTHIHTDSNTHTHTHKHTYIYIIMVH